MPLYDFECKACGRRFEELVFDGDANPPCPVCGCTDVYQLPASPSPMPGQHSASWPAASSMAPAV